MIQEIKLIFIISCFLCIFGITLAIIIKYYSGFSEYEYIWFCSKILTIKNMIYKISSKDQVFSRFNNNRKENLPNDYYKDYLGRVEEDKRCSRNYKTCGILDTYGNSFCLSPGINCPINKMKFDSSIKDSDYEDYQKYTLQDSSLNLYYKTGVLDNGIISSWVVRNSPPKYIDDNNFIMDMDAFEECFKDDDKDDDDDDDDDDDNEKDGNSFWKKVAEGAVEGAMDAVEDITKSAIKLARIKKLIDYIYDKMNKDENIDRNYTYINYNNYVKNYMGFKNLESLNNFNKIDFKVYKKRYPNYSSAALSITILCVFVFFIVVSTICFIKNRSIEFTGYFILIFSLIYVVSFLYLFIYSVVILARDFRNETFEVAKSVRADKFIEDFLKEFYEPFDKATFIICIIVFLSISAVFFILFWIIEPIYNCMQGRR